MRRFIIPSVVCCALGLFGVSGCTANVHDNTADIHDNTANIDDAKVSMESTDDMDNVEAGQTVHLDITAQNVFLIEPSESPPPDRVKVAGHFEIFMDDTTSSALLVTAQESVDVVIPPSTPMGKHKLLCRVDKHDGTATKASTELDLTVVASASASASGSASTN